LAESKGLLAFWSSYISRYAAVSEVIATPNVLLRCS